MGTSVLTKSPTACTTLALPLLKSTTPPSQLIRPSPHQLHRPSPGLSFHFLPTCLPVLVLSRRPSPAPCRRAVIILFLAFLPLPPCAPLLSCEILHLCTHLLFFGHHLTQHLLGHWQRHFETWNWLAQGKYVSPDFTPPQLHVQDRELPSALWRDVICTGISKRSRCGNRCTKKTGRAKCPSCTAQAQLYGSKRGPKPPRTGPHVRVAIHKQAAQGTYVPTSTDWSQGRHDRTA